MSNAKTIQHGFRDWLYEVDRILRGEATKPSAIRNADIKFPVVGVAIVVILLAAIYGLCMGIFALVRGVENSEYQQALLQTFASMCKVPLLFFLTLVVTFPSLYVFNALVGSKLKIFPVLKLLVASLAVNLAVLASMGPILAFFSVSTPNYPFIVLLNVICFAAAGMLGLVFLIQTLNRLSLSGRVSKLAEPRDKKVDKGLGVVAELDDSEGAAARNPVPAAKTPSNTVQWKSPLEQGKGIVLGHHVRKVFAIWIVVFGLVGAQMGWVLRPFIGAPGKPFQWFRERHSNFFEAVLNTFWEFLF
jgi:hypothetical protein